MKKIIFTASIILLAAVSGTGVWASEKGGTKHSLTNDQIAQVRAEKQRHQKKGQRGAFHVEGKASKGAPKVSPEPVKKKP